MLTSQYACAWGDGGTVAAPHGLEEPPCCRALHAQRTGETGRSPQVRLRWPCIVLHVLLRRPRQRLLPRLRLLMYHAAPKSSHMATVMPFAAAAVAAGQPEPSMTQPQARQLHHPVGMTSPASVPHDDSPLAVEVSTIAPITPTRGKESLNSAECGNAQVQLAQGLARAALPSPLYEDDRRDAQGNVRCPVCNHACVNVSKRNEHIKRMAKRGSICHWEATAPNSGLVLPRTNWLHELWYQRLPSPSKHK